MIDLSVHLITYNNEKHIEETLQSILKQKVDFNYEIVIGDDCSTDHTLDIINKFKKAHSDIIFDVKKNEKQLGILKNFKSTLDRCKGHYIFDIAGDDLLKNNDSLQKMVDVMKSNPNLGFVDSGYDELHDSNNSVKSFSNTNTITSSKTAYKNALQLGKISPVGICFNKKHLYDCVDFDVYINMGITIDDYPILVDLAMHKDFELINESLHVYRVHDDSYSHKRTFENQLFLSNQMKELFDYFSKKYNFSQKTIENFYKNHFKQVLFLSGYFEKKNQGKRAFRNLKSKNIKDYIHYFASQNSFFRTLISRF